MDDTATFGEQTLTLRRLHDEDDPSLRAWNAADVLAVDHLEQSPVDGDRWLVVNDTFGALAVALAERRPQSWSDSYVARRATAANLERNGYSPDQVRVVPATHLPEGPIDVAVIRIPKSSALLEAQLRALRPLLHERSVVVGAGMTKSIHTSTIASFEQAIGTTTTTRAVRKARLVLSTVDGPGHDADADADHGVVTWRTDQGVEVVNLPGVFSSRELDHGTQLLLSTLDRVAAGTTVIDLACGNGVVGATLRHRQPEIHLVCVDESYNAVESARRTVALAPSTPGHDTAFHVTDVLDGVAVEADLVVINPPFHAGGARTTSVAERMFVAAAEALRPDGEIRVVGNRQLDHHRTLQKHFRVVENVAADRRFVVLTARLPR